jgi:hypothetical protein
MSDSDSAQRSAHDRRQRRILIGIALMFFAPLAVCFYLYYGHVGWRPGGRVNAGELIEPPRPLPMLALPLLGSGSAPDAATTDANFLRRKWTFLYVATGPCADACRARLYDTRQVRLALDRDMNRVQRVLIADADCCDPQFLREQHPDLITVRSGGAASALLALLPGLEPPLPAVAAAGPDAPGGSDAPRVSVAGRAPRVYLVDPLGNLMMFYGPDAKSKGMLEDMKRLLRLSSIG